MPVKLGKKKYEKFSDASAAIQKKKGISKDRANAYVASVERKQGIEPRTGKRTKNTTSKRNNNSTADRKKTRQPQRKKTTTR
jgi:hypothetical protein